MSEATMRSATTDTAIRGRLRAASSNVALGSATAFIALVTMLSFVVEPGRRPDPQWHLRGTIAPSDGLGRTGLRTQVNAGLRLVEMMTP